MRICLLGPTYPFRGGISHYTTLLCRELRRNHEVKFLSFTRQYPAWLFPGTTDKDPSATALQVENVERVLDSLNPATWLHTAKAVCEFNPDLFIMPWWVAFWTPQFWVICKRVKRCCGARIVFLCHNVVEHESNLLKRWCTKWVLELGDRFVVHSREDKDNLVALLPSADIAVGFLPTYEDVSTTRVAKDEAKRQLELDGPVLLFFGFVRPYKGLDVLLEAMPLIRQHVPATLLVVGEFWKDKEEHLAVIDRLGLRDAVRIVDRYVPNEEIPLYFGASDLVVQPYRSATGSAVAQLAFGLERPLIATSVGCLPEVIEDGVDGRVVPPEDPGALARAVMDSLQPGVLAELNAGVLRAKEKFSWENMARLLTGEGT